MKFSVAALAFIAVPLALVLACGGENSPADNCREFLDLTTDCAEQAGRPLGTNAAACDDPSIEQPRTQAQMVCAIQNAPAYCATLKASLTGEATPELARDPAVIKLNACTVAFTAAEPCKAAILALGDCGAAIGLANTDTCTGQVATPPGASSTTKRARARSTSRWSAPSRRSPPTRPRSKRAS